MTADTPPDDYRAFLDRQDVATLRDWALHVARERRDVGFLWELTKHLPATEDLNRDWALLDPSTPSVTSAGCSPTSATRRPAPRSPTSCGCATSNTCSTMPASTATTRTPTGRAAGKEQVDDLFWWRRLRG
jgi:hypothetical protein